MTQTGICKPEEEGFVLIRNNIVAVSLQLKGSGFQPQPPLSNGAHMFFSLFFLDKPESINTMLFGISYFILELKIRSRNLMKYQPFKNQHSVRKQLINL